MFSGKFSFLKATVAEVVDFIINGIGSYLTLDYSYQAQPFVNVVPSSGIVNNSGLCSLDYSYQASPFYGNNIAFLNTSNPINNIIVDPNPDPYWSNVSLLIRGSGTHGSTTITDSSSYNHSITLPTAGGTNNAAISSGNYIFNNGSIIFDGEYDYLQLPSHSSLDFGSGNFTMEWWMRTNGAQDFSSVLFSRYTSSTNVTDFANNGSSLGFNNASSAAGKITSIGAYSQSIMNNGNWHHVAVTRSESSGNFISIFLDGSLVGASNNYANDNMSMNGGRIGRWQGNNVNDNNYNGYLSEIRFTKGINRYPITKDFTAPTSTYPTGVNDPYWNNVSLLLNFNGSNGSTTFTDISPRTKTVAVSGTPTISTAQSKFGGSSVYTDGTTGNLLSIVQNTDFAFGAGDFTVEGWVYITAYRSSPFYLLTTTNVSPNFSFYITTLGELAFWDGSATTAYTFGKSNMIPLNTWSHVAFVRNASLYRAYANGILVGSISASTLTNLLNNQDVNILTTLNVSNGSNPTAGYLDDLRVTKGVARYTVGSFTPQRLRFAGA